MDDFVAKPVDPQALDGALTRCLSRLRDLTDGKFCRIAITGRLLGSQ